MIESQRINFKKSALLEGLTFKENRRESHPNKGGVRDSHPPPKQYAWVKKSYPLRQAGGAGEAGVAGGRKKLSEPYWTPKSLVISTNDFDLPAAIQENDRGSVSERLAMFS
ncbi:MAG: hypothetical protein V7L01_22365 [Nostoc sp.]|uniref:hypothetical protein n=1 Tax=Nostoc sp. TaxID=1180 RepID=UPI002FF975B9